MHCRYLKWPAECRRDKVIVRGARFNVTIILKHAMSQSFVNISRLYFVIQMCFLLRWIKRCFDSLERVKISIIVVSKCKALSRNVYTAAFLQSFALSLEIVHVLSESLSGTNFNKFSRLSFPHAERLQPNQDDNKDLLTFQRCMVTFKRYFSVYTDLLPGSHRSLCPDHNESEE